MSNYYQEKNDIILKKNLSNLNLIDKNIIYSSQHILNDDTQIDSDGPQSSWNISVICIEKIEDDYIFHINYSDYIRGYSYPYFKVVNNFSTFSKKLSELKNDFNTILEKPTDKIGNFLKLWEDDYCCAYHSNDPDLINEMKILASKIESINETYEQRSTIENEERDKKYQEYLQSDIYKQYLKDDEERKRVQKLEYQKKEEERLKLCIKLYGEEKGREFHRRL
jgi:hypothetical protein